VEERITGFGCHYERSSDWRGWMLMILMIVVDVNPVLGMRFLVTSNPPSPGKRVVDVSHPLMRFICHYGSQTKGEVAGELRVD
jgi:hypothetical protein